MYTQVDKTNFQKKIQNAKIDFISYEEWMDKEDSKKQNFAITTTSNVLVRDKKDWNIKGREIYDKNRLNKHAELVIGFLEKCNNKNFIIKHEGDLSSWFPKPIVSKSKNSTDLKRKISFLNKRSKNFDTEEEVAFLVKEDITDFILMFMDYSYLMNYKDLEFFSLDDSFVMIFSSHLKVDFITDNKRFYKKTKSFWKPKKIENCNFIGTLD